MSKTPSSPPPADVARSADAARTAGVGEETVLESLRAFRAEEIRRDQGRVLLAVEWARLNPQEQPTDEDGDPDTPLLMDSMDELWWELAELGCPYVDELTIPAFADAAGMTEFQASKLLYESIMLVFLLPRVWERVSQGQLEVWRARKLAEECWGLTPEAIAYIDRNMSLATARHTEGGREGIIAEAKLRYMPEQAQEEEEAAKEQRGVGVSWEEHGKTGVASIWGTLDVPDAIDLEAAIAAGADALKELGSEAPLPVRRSWALGDLARASQSLAPRLPNPGRISESPSDSNAADAFFHPDCACRWAKRPRWDGSGTGSSRVMMYLHLTPDAFFPPAANEPLHDPAPGELNHSGSHAGEGEGRALSTSEARGEGDAGSGEHRNGFAPIRIEGNGIPSGTVLTPGTVQGWFTRPRAVPGPKVIFRPVLDLAEHQHVDAYEVPERIQEHVALRDGGCVFPWCHRKARNTDCDHTIPWKENGQGGPTCSCNLAPLCRRHHRAKTHADNHVGNRYTWWRYESLGEGKYLWQGPGGSRLLRTNTGVYDVSNEHVSNGPRTPAQRLRATTITDITGEDSGPEPTPRVVAAEKVVTRIVARLPRPETLMERYPAPEGEEPYVPEVIPREPSWRELFSHDFKEKRMTIDEILPPQSLLSDALRDFYTETYLFATTHQLEEMKWAMAKHKKAKATRKKYAPDVLKPRGEERDGITYYSGRDLFQVKIARPRAS